MMRELGILAPVVGSLVIFRADPLLPRVRRRHRAVMTSADNMSNELLYLGKRQC